MLDFDDYIFSSLTLPVPPQPLAGMELATPALSAPPTGKYLAFIFSFYIFYVFFSTVGPQVEAAPRHSEFVAFSRKLATVAPSPRT